MYSVPEGALLFVLKIFKKRHAGTPLETRIILKCKSLNRQKQNPDTSYGGAISYPFEGYIKNDEIAQDDTKIMHFTQLSNKPSI